MKKSIQFIAGLFAIFMLSACVQTTTDPEVGKADFLKYQQWIESGPLEDDPNMKEPETPEQMEKLIDTIFNQYTQEAKALELRHTEVRALRDKTVRYIDSYMKAYMKIYFLSLDCPESNSLKCEAFLESQAEAIKEKLQNMETEATNLENEYERLAKQFGVEVSGTILR